MFDERGQGKAGQRRLLFRPLPVPSRLPSPASRHHGPNGLYATSSAVESLQVHGESTQKVPIVLPLRLRPQHLGERR